MLSPRQSPENRCSSKRTQTSIEAAHVYSSCFELTTPESSHKQALIATWIRGDHDRVWITSYS